MKKLNSKLDEIKDSQKSSNEAKVKEETAAKKAETKKINCEASRKNLAGLEQFPRAKKKMKDGSYKTLGEEERQAEIEKARKRIEKYCD
jgi:hypothetical protein